MNVFTRNARIRLVLGILTISAAGFAFGTAAGRIANTLGF
jgi:adenine/guanine phosphoribosyltransferase-like PRPP-binding protein